MEQTKVRKMLCRILLIFLIALISFLILYTNTGALTGSWTTTRIYAFVVLLILLVVFTFLFFAIKNPKKSLPLLAFLTVLLLGLVYMLVLTPLSPPDERQHYLRSYHLSNYLLFQPDKELCRIQDFDFHGFTIHQNTAEGYQRIVESLAQGNPANPSAVAEIDLEPITYPLLHLPQAVGITVARILGLPFIWLFYLGRFCNLLSYALCVFFAVRAVPKKKGFFFAAGIMPMALHQAASYSYDAFTNGMTLFFIALCYSAIRSEQPMTKKEFGTLTIVSILMAPAKVVYVFYGALVFLIPARRFVILKKKPAVGIIFSLMLAAAIVSWLPSALSGSAVNYNPLSEVYSLSYLWEHPLSALMMFWETLTFGFMPWLSDSIGQTFSGLSMVVPQYLSVLWLILLFLLVMHKRDNPLSLVSRPERIVYLSVSAITVLSILFTMFITWTPVGSARIIGIQGRYFIPLIPLLFLSLETKFIQWTGKDHDRDYLCLTLLIHLLILVRLLGMTT